MALALWAMVARISTFGFSPNKTATLGLNLLLLVNMAWSAVLYARFLGRRIPFTRLERWQTAYLPAFAVWAHVPYYRLGREYLFIKEELDEFIKKHKKA